MSYIRMRLGRPSRMVGGLSKNMIPAGGQRHKRYVASRSLSPPLLLSISLYPSLPLSLSRSLTFCIPLSSLHPSLPLSLSLYRSLLWELGCVHVLHTFRIRLDTLGDALRPCIQHIPKKNDDCSFAGLLSIRFLKFGERLLTFLRRFLFPLFTIDTFA